MESISVHICALIIIVVLLYFTFRGKSLELYSTRVYKISLVMALFTMIFNIASMIALFYYETLPVFLTEFLSKGYLILVLLVYSFSYIYICTGIYTRLSRRVYEKVGFFWGIAGSVIIAVLPTEYRFHTTTYHAIGYSVNASYLINTLTILAILVFILVKRENMIRRRFYSVLTWMLVNLAGLVTQFFVHDFPLTGFGIAMGLNIIFSSLESPETYRDRETGVFNTYAKSMIMEQNFHRGKSFSLLSMSVDLSRQGLSYELHNNIYLHIANILLSMEKARVFRHTTNIFSIILDNEKEAKEHLALLKQVFGKPLMISGKSIDLHPSYMIIADSDVVSDSEDIHMLQNYFITHNTELETIIIDNNMINDLHHQQEVKAMILEALDEDRLEIFLQPIYGTKTNTFVSAEALARIRDKEGYIISPGEYIPIAESSYDLITAIGERVFRKVCEYIRDHDIRAMGMHYIEVNLSVEQCEMPTLADDFLAIIRENGIDPTLVCMEITESASIKNREILLNNMNKLREHEIFFCLDDFGTGESNLNYVMTMPVDIIKFDKDLTQAYFENLKAKFVMDSVIDMVKNMDMTIVSEGVETLAQLETVTELGIDYVQGYYFSKPLPTNEFTAFIKEHNNV